ncbi:MAG: putative metal-dependent hydrolase of the TIM-barrel fold [Ktedonobacterales bacterium]|jgi:predicted TIM-barrel fold metal-dependent hydrolase|nr:MAG: putative metal-dependent hydrolase of the TIM-barrel fold [Ktedonobacterales bacterium]
MIIDFHTHIFPPGVIARREEFCRRDPWLGELYGNPQAKMATADDLIAAMTADGVDVSVAFPFGWSDAGLAEECNSYVIEAMRRFPGRILGLAAVQPRAGARAVAELERCAAAGMPGFGELMPHGQGYRLSDIALLAPLVEAALSLGMFCLTHTSEPVGHTYHGKGDVTPHDFQTFIQAFPSLRVVAAHWGGGFPFYELMPEVHAAAANVWYDSAASLYLYRPDIFPTVARIAGPEKILFGSDFPLIGQGRMLAYARSAGLSEAELALALGGNAAALLGLAAS